MHGTITSKELFLHWLTIVRLWGARCYLRCLRARLGSDAIDVPRGRQPLQRIAR